MASLLSFLRGLFGGARRTREVRDRREGARHVTAALARCLSTTRLYGTAHPSFEEDLARLYRTIRERSRSLGDLTLRVEVDRLELEGQAILRSRDPMIEMLFDEGIASITFHARLGEQNLRSYLVMWHGALATPDDPERSFASLAWEADIPGITTRLRSTFGQYSGSRADELKHHYESLLRSIREVGPQGSLEGALASGGGGDPAAPQGPRASSLSDHELNTLYAQVSASAKGAGQRVLMRLWYEFRLVDVDGSQELLHLAASVIDGLARGGRTDELVRAFTRITASARGDASAEVQLARFTVALGNQKVVSTLVSVLTDEEAGRGALFLLRELPSAFTEQIVSACVDAPAASRAQLVPILAAKDVAPHLLAIWLLALGETMAEMLIDLGEKMSPHHLDSVLRVALLAESADIRARALARVSGPSADRFRSLLELNADHEDPRVRAVAIHLLLPLADRHALALFEKKLVSLEDPESVQLWCVKALGTIGTARAIEPLLAALKAHPSSAVRVLAAQTLSAFSDDRVKSALALESKKWFGDRHVISASRMALRRMAS